MNQMQCSDNKGSGPMSEGGSGSGYGGPVGNSNTGGNLPGPND